MPFDYEFPRHIRPDGRYDIDNPVRLDGEGNQIHLASEVRAVFPSLIIKVQCMNLTAKITTEVELSAEDQAVLTQVVLDHQANA